MQRTTELRKEYNQLSEKVNALKGQIDYMERELKETNNKIESLNSNKLICSQAIEFLTLIQQANREEIKRGFEALVTYALRYIYNDEYTFKLEFGRRGNLQGLDFMVETPEMKEPRDPMICLGGGVLDIISFALRISLLELSIPKTEGFIMMDETFKHLSAKYLPRASEFLKIINKKIGRQILFISHQNTFINNADNLIKIGE